VHGQRSTTDRHDDVTIDLDAHLAASAADRYSAWAERLRAKRQRDQERILGAEDAAEGARGYWHADDVLAGAETAASADDEALGVLGLARGATAEEVVVAYRRLAKQHHPDRWVGADEATRRAHAETMLRVNAALQTVRAASA
jgi:DnaJ-domain-containing protein 1